MASTIWAKAAKEVGVKPLSEGMIGGDSPLYVQHWVCQAREVRLSGFPCPVLLTQLGGAYGRGATACPDTRWSGDLVRSTLGRDIAQHSRQRSCTAHANE